MVKCSVTKVTTKSSASLAAQLSLKGTSGQQCMAGLGACSYCFISHMAAMVEVLAGHLVPLHPVGLLPDPSPPYFSTACQCDSCLDSWHGDSWLGCGDGQPWECYSVQGAGWPASSGSPWTSQTPNLHFTMYLGRVMRKGPGQHILSIFSFKLFCPLHSPNNIMEVIKVWK